VQQLTESLFDRVVQQFFAPYARTGTSNADCPHCPVIECTTEKPLSPISLALPL
jgi:hypothetical protein